MISNGKHGLNAGWTLQNINLTAKVILTAIAIIAIIAGGTTAWVRQEMRSAVFSQRISKNCEDIVVFRERQHTTEIELTKLNAAINRLNENIDRLEKTLSK